MSVRSGADLHVHTTHSDGACSPASVVNAAFQVGLEAVAITDHDTVGGVEIARLEAVRLGIELVAGIEWTAELEGKEIHILGHFVRSDDTRLAATAKRLRTARAERLDAMAGRLGELGLKIDLEGIRRAFPKAALGRRHLAEWLRITKQVENEREAFTRYLGDGGPADVPKARLPWLEAIAITKGAGGVAGLAHPPYNLREATFQMLVEGGLGSIETAGPGINPRCGRRWKEWAERAGIVPTAGSDFHAQDRPGRWVGAAKTSSENLAKLRAASGSEQKSGAPSPCSMG